MLPAIFKAVKMDLSTGLSKRFYPVIGIDNPSVIRRVGDIKSNYMQAFGYHKQIILRSIKDRDFSEIHDLKSIFDADKSFRSIQTDIQKIIYYEDFFLYKQVFCKHKYAQKNQETNKDPL